MVVIGSQSMVKLTALLVACWLSEHLVKQWVAIANSNHSKFMPRLRGGSYALGRKILLYSKETHGNQSNSKERGNVDKALPIL